MQEGLDPLGIIRGEAAERLIPLPGDLRHVDWAEGMRVLNMSVEERAKRREEQINAR